MRFLNGLPTRHVLEKLGAALRDQYRDLVSEPVPDHLRRLLDRFRLQRIDEPKRGKGGPTHFTSR